MIVPYCFVDLIATVSQAMIIFVAVNGLCRTLRVKYGKLLLPIIWGVFTYFWTWVIADGTWKLMAQLILIIILCRLFYKDSAFNIIVASFMGLIFNGACESLTLLIGQLFTDSMTVYVEGYSFASIPLYITCIMIDLVFALTLYFLFRNFRYQLHMSDFIIILLFEMVVFLLFNNRIVQFVAGTFDERIELIVVSLAVAFIIVFLYLKNTYYLREQEQRDRIQIAQLQQQYTYYQDKLKDEERIRSIYHDMKNHLLVLEGSQSTDITRQMAQELRSQIADYENYIHTGNDFLDIIIKDKAEKAREKHIDFSAIIDFGGIYFIKPLDISTLFGNGIDNAIEASEKLSVEQRVILIKAGKVQDFVSILMENNYVENNKKNDNHTSKVDKLLHGFGIANMKKAAEKYNGTCTITQRNGKFTLKILLPVSAGKAVD